MNRDKTKCGFKPTLMPEKTKVLILGTFPGEESLEIKEDKNLKHYYYANIKHNNFWDIIFDVLNIESIPNDYEEKIKILSNNGICLWDLIKSCIREDGSRDKDIKDAIPNNLEEYIRRNVVILVNGSKNTIKKIKFRDRTQKRMIINLISDNSFMPSTSKANTHKTLNKKIEIWNNTINKK